MRPVLVALATLAPAVGNAHEEFCRACADRAAALLTSAPVLTATRSSTSPAALVATPFTLSEASLTPTTSGLEWRAQQTNLAYLLMLNVSSLAYNFRNTSRLPLHNATPFGGWETPYGPYGDDRGHFTGHYLSAAALMANATGNAELRTRSRELVSALAECQAANAKVFPRFGPGYLSGAPTTYFDCLENLWRKPCRYMQVPYYNVHKIMAGLLDQHTLLGDAQALEVSFSTPPHGWPAHHAGFAANHATGASRHAPHATTPFSHHVLVCSPRSARGPSRRSLPVAAADPIEFSDVSPVTPLLEVLTTVIVVTTCPGAAPYGGLLLPADPSRHRNERHGRVGAGAGDRGRRHERRHVQALPAHRGHGPPDDGASIR